MPNEGIMWYRPSQTPEHGAQRRTQITTTATATIFIIIQYMTIIWKLGEAAITQKQEEEQEQEQQGQEPSQQ